MLHCSTTSEFILPSLTHDKNWMYMWGRKYYSAVNNLTASYLRNILYSLNILVYCILHSYVRNLGTWIIMSFSYKIYKYRKLRVLFSWVLASELQQWQNLKLWSFTVGSLQHLHQVSVCCPGSWSVQVSNMYSWVALALKGHYILDRQRASSTTLIIFRMQLVFVSG